MSSVAAKVKTATASDSASAASKGGQAAKTPPAVKAVVPEILMTVTADG